MTLTRGMTSTGNGEWHTPPHIVAWAKRTHAIDLDVAATAETTVCDRWLRDGLSEPWDGRVWLQPPYGRGLMQWSEKARDELCGVCPIVVALLPARTDARWWHYLTEPLLDIHVAVHLLCGRVAFIDRNGREQKQPPFPSAILVMTRTPRAKP